MNEEKCSSESEGESVADAEQQLAESIKSKLPDGSLDRDTLADIIAKSLSSVLTVEFRRLEHFQGPLPPPRMLREYEDVQKGLVERINNRAEKEQEFRHEMGKAKVSLEHRALTHRAGQGYVGQACAFVIAMSSIGAGVYLINAGKSTEGLAAILVPIGGIAATFVAGKAVDVWREWRKQHSDNDET